MTAKLRQLVQMLNECENDSSDDDCVACKLFSAVFDNDVEIDSKEISLNYLSNHHSSPVSNQVLEEDDIWRGATSN